MLQNILHGNIFLRESDETNTHQQKQIKINYIICYGAFFMYFFEISNTCTLIPPLPPRYISPSPLFPISSLSPFVSRSLSHTFTYTHFLSLDFPAPRHYTVCMTASTPFTPPITDWMRAARVSCLTKTSFSAWELPSTLLQTTRAPAVTSLEATTASWTCTTVCSRADTRTSPGTRPT